jgi:hypothetical protein
MLLSCGLPPSCMGGIGSAGVPGCDGGGFWLLYSRCTSACREARRLISRNPTRSPRLKLPLPCLNSHNVASGVPCWNTSLTAGCQRLTCASGASLLTFVEAVHIQLSHERRDVGVLKVLANWVSHWACEASERAGGFPYASTFENSCEGCMTKLSEVGVHEMRCWIVLSSNMLSPLSASSTTKGTLGHRTCTVCG